MIGLSVPAANGASVRGTRATEISLHNPLETSNFSNIESATFRKPNDSCHELEMVRGQKLGHWLVDGLETSAV